MKRETLIETYESISEGEKNPAHFCDCGKFLGYRGFCSVECHNKHYDAKSENTVKNRCKQALDRIESGDYVSEEEFFTNSEEVLN